MVVVRSGNAIEDDAHKSNIARHSRHF